MFAIWKFGSEEQKQQLAARMAAGELVGCFGLTEPDFGSNPAGMRTRAKRDGDDWVLERHQDVDHQRLGRRRRRGLGRDRRGRGRASAASSSRPTPRASPLRRSASKLSLRASVTSRAGAGGRAAAGRRRAARGRRPARPAVLPERGAVRHRLRRARRRPRLPGDGARLRRHPGGVRPAAGSFQLTQAKLADMALELQKGFLLALHLGRLKDDARPAARAGQPGQAQQRPRGAGRSPASAARSSAPAASRWSTRCSGTPTTSSRC